MNYFPIIPANKTSLSLRKPLYGVGVNDADYIVRPEVNGKRVFCPYYNTWAHMIERCYSEKRKNQNPTYRDAKTCDEWLVFSVFRSWMEKQDWKGKDLDKDIIVKGNKTYSPSTCLFVSHHVNNLLNDSLSIRGKSKIGVSKNKRTGRFEAYVNDFGRKVFLGHFNNESDAYSAYSCAKKEIIIRFANKQDSEKVKLALLNRAKLID